MRCGRARAAFLCTSGEVLWEGPSHKALGFPTAFPRCSRMSEKESKHGEFPVKKTLGGVGHMLFHSIKRGKPGARERDEEFPKSANPW